MPLARARSHPISYSVRFKLTFSLEKVDILSKRWSGGDYNEINPKSYVPALKLDDGDMLTECAVILQFIADLKPEQGFMPAPPLPNPLSRSGMA